MRGEPVSNLTAALRVLPGHTGTPEGVVPVRPGGEITTNVDGACHARIFARWPCTAARATGSA